LPGFTLVFVFDRGSFICPKFFPAFPKKALRVLLRVERKITRKVGSIPSSLFLGKKKGREGTKKCIIPLTKHRCPLECMLLATDKKDPPEKEERTHKGKKRK
jgi:hypothetical protein